MSVRKETCDTCRFGTRVDDRISCGHVAPDVRFGDIHIIDGLGKLRLPTATCGVLIRSENTDSFSTGYWPDQLKQATVGIIHFAQDVQAHLQFFGHYFGQRL